MTVTLLVCTYLERYPSSAENRSQGISTLWPTVKYRSVENELGKKRDFELTYFHLCCIILFTSTNIRAIRTCAGFSCVFCFKLCLFEHVDRSLGILLPLLFSLSKTHFLFQTETKKRNWIYLYAICFLSLFYTFAVVSRNFSCLVSLRFVLFQFFSSCFLDRYYFIEYERRLTEIRRIYIDCLFDWSSFI